MSRLTNHQIKVFWLAPFIVFRMNNNGISDDLLNKLIAIKKLDKQRMIKIAEPAQELPKKRPHEVVRSVSERKDCSQSILDKLCASLDAIPSEEEEEEVYSPTIISELEEDKEERIGISSVLKMLRIMDQKLSLTAGQLRIAEKYGITLQTNFWNKPNKSAFKKFKKRRVSKGPFSSKDLEKELDYKEHPYIGLHFKMIPYQGSNSIRLLSLKSTNKF